MGTDRGSAAFAREASNHATCAVKLEAGSEPPSSRSAHARRCETIQNKTIRVLIMQGVTNDVTLTAFNLKDGTKRPEGVVDLLTPSEGF